jgi:hypothetical protein
MTNLSITKVRGPAESYGRPLSHTFMVGRSLVTLTFDLNRAQQLSSTWSPPSFPRKLSQVASVNRENPSTQWLSDPTSPPYRMARKLAERGVLA